MADEKKKEEKKEDGMMIDILKRITKYVFLLSLIMFILFIVSLAIATSLKENGKACYYRSGGARSISYTLDVSKIEYTGKTVSASNTTEAGQEIIWKDTGFKTNGEMEIAVSGYWCPFGENATPKVPNLNNASSINQVFMPKPCIISNDTEILSYCGAESAALATKVVDIEKFSNDSFYRSCVFSNNKEVSMQNADNSYIADYHVSMDNLCDSFKTNGNWYDIIAKNYKDTVSNSGEACALYHGYGVYMKIGNNQYAYHLNNYTHLIKDANGFFTYDPNGVTVPFTLPAKAFKYNSSEYNYNINSRAQHLSTNSLKEDFDKCAFNYNSDVTGFETLPLGQKIYVGVSALDYSKADGKVYIDFIKGAADRENTDGILKRVWNAIIINCFGVDIYHEDGVQISDSGFLVILRNAVLKSALFQVAAYSIILLMFLRHGYEMIIGKFALGVQLLISKFIYIGFAVWALQVENYKIFDEVFIPSVISAFDWLTQFVMTPVMALSDINVTSISHNPFVVFDALLDVILGKEFIAKAMAMFWEAGSSMPLLCPVLLYMLMVTYISILTRSSFYILSMVKICFTFILLPIMAIMIFLVNFEDYKKQLDAYVAKIIKEMVASVGGILSFTIIVSAMMYCIRQIVDFETCIEEWFWGMWYWRISGTYSASQSFQYLFMLFILQNASKPIDNFIQGIIGSIFGSDKNEQFGKSLAGDLVNTVVNAPLEGINQGYQAALKKAGYNKGGENAKKSPNKARLMPKGLSGLDMNKLSDTNKVGSMLRNPFNAIGTSFGNALIDKIVKKYSAKNKEEDEKKQSNQSNQTQTNQPATGTQSRGNNNQSNQTQTNQPATGTQSRGDNNQSNQTQTNQPATGAQSRGNGNAKTGNVNKTGSDNLISERMKKIDKQLDIIEDFLDNDGDIDEVMQNIKNIDEMGDSGGGSTSNTGSNTGKRKLPAGRNSSAPDKGGSVANNNRSGTVNSSMSIESNGALSGGTSGYGSSNTDHEIGSVMSGKKEDDQNTDSIGQQRDKLQESIEKNKKRSERCGSNITKLEKIIDDLQPDGVPNDLEGAREVEKLGKMKKELNARNEFIKKQIKIDNAKMNELIKL